MVSSVHIDFETRSRADLEEVGAWEYFSHPSTTILCAVFAVDDDTEYPYVIRREELNMLNPKMQWLKALAEDPNVIFVAHNAMFEYLAIYFWFTKLGFPVIPESRWRCTLAKAASHGLPLSLEGCSTALCLPDIKDTVGKNTMMKLSRPRKPTKNNPSEWHDDPADYETLYQYCAQDVRVEAKIDKQIRNLTAHEQSVWELDFRMNLRGLRVDIDAIETALAVHSKFQEERLRRFSAIVGGAFTPTQRSLVQKWLNSVLDLDEPISDTQAGTLESLLDIATGETKEAIEIFLSSTKASLAKLTSMLNYSDSEGRCRGQFQYHAASTGRWGGRGIQPQNLVRGNADYPPSVYFNYLLGEML